MDDLWGPYRLVLMGPSKSGKTVFLACMYNSLRQETDERQFFLRLDLPSQVIRLTQLYSMIADTSDDWPSQTTRSELFHTEFGFASVDQGRDRVYNAFRFSCLDYAGDMFEGHLDGAVPDEEFDHALQQATSLVAVIDGCDLLDYMDRKLRPDDMLRRYAAIWQIIHDTVRSNFKPVHFILTKWDLFDLRHVTLKQAVEALKDFSEFKNCLIPAKASRGGVPRYPVRLIPVSAIGDDFAIREHSSRKMDKQPGRVPNGFNLEMPLACALYDRLEITVEQLRAELERKTPFFVRLFQSPGTKPILDVIKKMKLRKVEKMLAASPLPWPARLFLLTAVAVMESGKGSAVDRVEKAMQLTKPAEVTADELRGRTIALVEFDALVAQLDSRYPDNRIVR